MCVAIEPVLSDDPSTPNSVGSEEARRSFTFN
jgi:hypothetical protein